MNRVVFKGQLLLVGLLLLGLVATPGLADDALKRVVDRTDRQKLTAVVEAINTQNRMVTIRSLVRDEVISMEVGDQVRNLDQVEVGDRVVIEFLEAMAVDLKIGGGLAPAAGMMGGATRAQPGQMPAGSMGKEVVLVATILGMDPDEPSVLLQGPQGNVVEVLVKDSEKLKQVDVGDQVVITYLRALAIAVEPSPVARPGE